MGAVAGYVELYTEPRAPSFIGLGRDYLSAKAVILGVPYDAGSTFRPGCRLAPARVREVSQNLETYDPVSRVDSADLPVADVGDLQECISPLRMVELVSKVAAELSSSGRVVVGIGGDHTVTLGLVKGLGRPVSLVMFDAHLDYRDEYPEGEKLSHATVLRRLRETGLIKDALVVGARGVSREEVEALDEDVRVLYAWSDLSALRDELSALGKPRYVTVDVDVLDPSVAPGVSCPEPGGLSYLELQRALLEVLEDDVVGLDVVEVNPLLDINDVTSYAAAKLIIRALPALVR
ncbi:MAG: agmatinase [Thermoprotei archaeon]|nr:MAG: agmatinase [Thermoprotei archaeon]RLE98503.1 MAG: agmatinase [Thermoprotei archaeon]